MAAKKVENVVVANPLGNKKGEVRTVFNEGESRYEIRVALTGTVDYGELADEVERVGKLLKPTHTPLAEVRTHLAHNFRLYGSGMLDGVFVVTWKRTDAADKVGASHDMLVTVKRSW